MKQSYIILFKPLPNAKRIKLKIPYEFHDIRSRIKKMDSSYWHPHQKLWSLVNSPENMEYIKAICKTKIRVSHAQPYRPIPKVRMNEAGIEALLKLEKTLILKRYSQNTIQNYKSMLSIFLMKFRDRDLAQVERQDIESFIFDFIKKNGIGESMQNQLINAIKAYYEHVLKRPKAFYNIERPKKASPIPNVLSEQDVIKLINTPENLKHKAILWTIYSGGLRISEVINLRIEDINSKDGYIFIKDSKGKRDRKTVLSPSLLPLLRSYYISYKPSYWLFEGRFGGQYTQGSVRKFFRKALEDAGINPWATVHTLRHSFATHCIMNNVNLRHVQNMLGHASPRTTQIYTKTIEINNKKINSPLDRLLNMSNFTNNTQQV
ncbi:tyrosine-type recombinase/integrase [Winogradskyella forsetii]|uniref:tyrosine-type recombinase/integrase n=1 Tax=Winogradskyella forsetii TaxID=2686077 RepID=UPI0015BCD2D9|nr:tyrosine-type recombinase/integrase [Winogradskyella forsetii]